MADEAAHPEWPDKAMFAAILLILAGSVGVAFELLRPLVEVDQDRLPSLFTDDIPFYTVSLALVTLASGVLALRYQAALFAYVGAVAGIASLGLFGLVPALALLAVAMMVKSHLEGEETRFDGVQLHAGLWPDKAMAASLFLVVVGGVALTQGTMILTGHFDPIALSSAPLAGGLGLGFGLLCLVAGNRVYHLRWPWLGWVALVGGVGTLGFYLIGPVLAVAGMVLLGLAHREEEFLLHGPGSEQPAARAMPRARAKGKPAAPRKGKRGAAQ